MNTFSKIYFGQFKNLLESKQTLLKSGGTLTRKISSIEQKCHAREISYIGFSYSLYFDGPEISQLLLEHEKDLYWHGLRLLEITHNKSMQ